MGIERHVEDGCRAARRRRARTGGEAFPIRATRLIEMNVGVDDAGKNGQIVGASISDFAEPDKILRQRATIFPSLIPMSCSLRTSKSKSLIR